MKSFNYKKINAFTTDISSGNPAACIYLDAGQKLNDADMQIIARDHKGFVSEVIFCTPEDTNTFFLRYYSSECEVEFCGHGTIACMYDLIKNNCELNKVQEVFIDTPKGRLTVYNELQTLNSVFISAPEAEFLDIAMDAVTAAVALGIAPTSISEKQPISMVNAGLNTLIVPITTLETELSMQPDEQSLKVFCYDHSIDIILVYTTDVSDPKNLVRTRVFAPKFGYLEDKATGSGNSALGYFMLRHTMWDGHPVSIEQNGELSAYNTIRLKMTDGKVMFGGSATVQIDGKYIY